MSIDQVAGHDDAVARTLERARRELLDFGLRNPLISYRLTRGRGVTVVDESPAEVFAALVHEARRLSFEPAPDMDETSSLPQPESPAPPVPLTRRFDLQLQTPHTSSELQSRLLRTFYDARTSIEEQGVNVLFLALGMLQWFESADSQTERRAPLVLVPVELERSNALDRFHLVYSGEEVGDNLSIAARIESEFGIEMPPMPEMEDLDLDAYFDAVEGALTGYPRWSVDRDAIVLGFFSFGKFLMYRDLDTETWPETAKPDDHPIVQSILTDGFNEPPSAIGDDDFLDTKLEDQEIYQVVDADSSQTLTIVDAINGRNLVVQGPPGTGKSQTITNIIAEAIGAGKTVLFVAEKMAALEVVKRRLDQVGLGDACLELHSHKINKRSVIHELQRTLDLGKPRLKDVASELSTLEDLRHRLNDYCDAINTPVGESGVTPFVMYGDLVRIRRTEGEQDWPRIGIDGIAGWTGNEFNSRLNVVRELQARVVASGVPSDHPFWGVRKTLILPTEEPGIRAASTSSLEHFQRMVALAASLAGKLAMPAPADLDAVREIIAILRRAAAVPFARAIDITTADWATESDRLDILIRSGKQRNEIIERRSGEVVETAWDRDVQELRDRIAGYRDKFWRSLSGGYRSARSEVSGLCTGEAPASVDAQVALLDDIIDARRLASVIDDHRDAGARLFGPHWQGMRSDWDQLAAWSSGFADLHRAVRLGDLPQGVLAFLAQNDDRTVLESDASELETATEAYLDALRQLQAVTSFDAERRFGAGASLEASPFIVQFGLLKSWVEAPDRINEIVALNVSGELCAEHGMPQVFDLTMTWEGAAEHLADVVRRARLEALLDQAILTRPALNSFDGDAHQQVIERFRQLDVLTFEHNRARLALSHWSRVPRGDGGGQLAILRREFEKKSRHLPVRRLVERAGNAIQAIKPVFMMSPLSIATYIPPGSVTFDMVVFDEASQVKPVEAFGALLRGSQAVVVGDSRQLPPTSFFDTLTHAGDEIEEEDVTSDIESILGLFAASNAPQRMLRWHYRSRHESLITVSNYEFYDNRLVLFPSPDSSREEYGLAIHHLPDTSYDRGGSRSNVQEAVAVAEAVMEHARSYPDLTLGVAAFSTAQTQAVLDQVERLRREDPSCEAFFSAHPFEPFFVKNLENVQGDERDVIYISVGYGRDANGHLTMNFGPLNNNGGERRLNVLITRARRRCEVFTNITGDDIRLNENSQRGLVAFKRFLKYAETGILDVPRETGGDFDSPFEAAVHDAITNLGYQVDKQVGSAGFFIDLAVVDPRRPGRYLLAVECDGATYHSARSARDRDRLRQSVLENLGWQVHRIWSTDWFRNQEREVARLKAVIDAALAREPVIELPVQEPVEAAIERDDDHAHDDEPDGAAYVVARIQPGPSGIALHQVPLGQMAEWVTDVVRVESPVHRSEVARRIADGNGVSRVGSRIRSAVDSAIAAAGQRGTITQRGDILWLPEMQTPPVRDRSRLPNASRSIDLIAPEEVDEAIFHVVGNAYGIDLPDVAPAVCRMFGFQRATEGMQSVIHEHIELLVATGRLIQQGIHLTASDNPPA